ncbi:signal transducer and activator of transcription 2 isoform X2 [Melanerpes formicivorus]|uniref:signal transducer and activator of transcription 2 isoform X2 n=1 Tax=Melanerpes formicivorus TaxID=211600 RepID=UPI00358FF2B0
MAQWQEVQGLANPYLEQVHQLYASAALPMAVRQCLAAWIEDQDWRQAAEPLSSHGRVLFHSLLALLSDHLGSPRLGDEDFMLKHNLRKARRDLQAEFEECPEQLANLVANLLQEERKILRLGQAVGQGGGTVAPSTPPVSDRQQQIQQRLAEFRSALQEVKHTFRHLEEHQDSFDFFYKLHYHPGEDRTNDPHYAQQVQALQGKLQMLNRQRQEVLAQLQQLLGRSETLRDFLQQELEAWQERQQRSCLGAPVDTSLRLLEAWFTELGKGLFQLLQLLQVLEDLRQKVTYKRDPLKAETPLLGQRLRELLSYLLRSAFVVEQQPCMASAGRRPLVLRTGSKFSARARLLVRLHDRSHRMEAKIHIDRDPPKIKGFRKFNILTSSSKTLLAGDNPQEGLVCDFQYLTLKEQKDSRTGKGSKGTSEGPLVVMEELHLITFTLAYAYQGLELELETSTLPFVIISNNSQLSSAWASILWLNMLSSDPRKEQQFFSKPPAAPWPLLGEVLSWQFQSVAERGLSPEHLLMLGKKLFGSKPSPESTLAWHKFSKEGSCGFSFWAWLDAILGLLQEHLKQLWKAGLILGFVSRKQEQKLLRSCRAGTFLIRFSESVLGGVTCTWVEHPEGGPPVFQAVDPYTAADLAHLALPDIIRDYQMLAEENVPENPLRFLYPGTARDEALGPYYSRRQEGDLLEQQKYLKQRLIHVSSRHPNELWKTEKELVAATEDLETLQLQPGGLGTQGPPGLASPQPGSVGTLQVTPGSVGTLQPGNMGTLQVTPGSVGTLQPGSVGTLQVTPGSVGTLQPGNMGTLQVTPGSVGTLQPGSVGTLQPGSVGTLQVTPGSVGTLQPGSVGTLQVTPGSVGTLQVTPGSVGTLQPGSVGTLQVTPGSVGTLQPGSVGTLQVTPGSVGTLQPGSVGTLQVTPGSVGTLQVTSGSVGTLPVIATSLGILQVTPGKLGTLQVMSGSPGGTLQPSSPGTLQVLATGLGTLTADPQGLEPAQPLQVGSGVSEMLPAGLGSLESQLVLQLLPEGQGMLQLGPGGLGTLQVLPTGVEVVQQGGPQDQGTQQVGGKAGEPGVVLQLLPDGQGTLQLAPGGLGMLQQVGAGGAGLLVPEEQEALPAEPRELQPLPGSSELLGLTSEALQAPELLPDMLEAMDRGLGGLASSAALLDPRDPFLPQAEDVALPPVRSLFSADFPQLHINANDFQ